MKVEVTIPAYIVSYLITEGYTEEKIPNIFKLFLKDYLFHPYGQSEENFEQWFSDMEDYIDEEIERLK